MKEIFEDFFDFIFPKELDRNNIEHEEDESLAYKIFIISLMIITCVLGWILLR